MSSTAHIMTRAKTLLSSLVAKQPLYTHLEVPDVFREPFILTGYRALGRSWTYYLVSLFQLHNETLNVWSHLLGLLYVFYRTYEIGTVVDYREPQTWGILALTVGAAGYTSLSTLAHLIHSRSAHAHFLCYQIDYIGICLNCQCAGIATYYLVGTETLYRTVGWEFLLINAICGVSVCAGCSISKLCYRRPYPFVSKLWRLIPGTLSGIVCGCMPIFFATYSWMRGQNDGELLRECYTIVAWTALGTFFFISYIPERFAPGMFDIFGHSHSIFHVILVYISHLQFDAVMLGYHRTMSKDKVSVATPTLITTFGFQALAIMGCVLVLYLTRVIRQQRVNGLDACLMDQPQSDTNGNVQCQKLKGH